MTVSLFLAMHVLDSNKVECSGPGNHSTPNCYEYYQCTKFLWWWQAQLKKCPNGQVYDKSVCKCASDQDVKCFDPGIVVDLVV